MPWKIAFATSETSARVGRGRGDHRGEHLGRRDRGDRVAAGKRQQVALHPGDLLDRELDPEVAAGDHDPGLDRLHDLLGAFRRLRLLDLGDHRDVRAAGAHPALDRGQVLGPAHEGDREQVDPLLDREIDPGEILAPGGGQADLGAREVEPLMGGDAAPDLDRAADLVVARLQHPQADAPVGEVDEPVLGHGLRESVEGDRELLVAADDVLGREHDLAPRPQADDPVVDVADPQLRARQVAEDADLLAAPLRGLARHRHVLRVIVAGPVGEVEPEDVGAGLDQLEHALDGASRGADRRHDLCPPVTAHDLRILSVGATVVGASLSSSRAGAGVATASNSPVCGRCVGSGPSSGSSSAPSGSSSRCT